MPTGIPSDTADEALTVSRARSGPGRLLWLLDTRWGSAAMFAVALGIRLLIAPRLGFFQDLRFFRIWAGQLRYVGFRHFYVGDTSFDYPPGYLYVLALIGHIQAVPSYLLLKMPAILGDLALAWISGVFAVRLAPEELKERLPVRAIVAAAVLFNPAVLALGAAWGQVDVVPVFFVVASLFLLLTGPKTARREIASMVLFAIGFSMKPQSSFLFPAMGYVLYRRHLLHRSPREMLRGAVQLVAIGASGLVLWAVSGIPFGLSPTGLLHFYSRASAAYKVTSVWAFNFWGITGFWRGDVHGAVNPVSSAVTTVLGVPAFYVGGLAYAAATVWVIWRGHRSIEAGHDEPRVVLVMAAMTSLVAFTVLTRMHERYMFPALAYLAPLVLWRGFRRAYAALSALFVINLWYPFAGYNLAKHVTSLYNEPIFRNVYGNVSTTDTWQKKGWSVLVVVACVVLVVRGFRWIEQVDWAVADPAGAPSRPLRLFRAISARALPARVTPTRTAPAEASADGSAAAAAVEPTLASRIADNRSRLLKLLPVGVVLVACVFSLVVLRSETTPATNLNDSAFHLQMVHWADHQISAGHVPLDGWFPDLSLGSSFFHHYQSLPYTLTAYAARATGLGDQTTYLWIQYLLIALWPISVYLGARLLGLERWPAAAAALVSPLVVSASGYGYEHGSYTWQGYGVYTQLFAMHLLPITWGLTWRAVSKRKGYALAALALALCIAMHLMTGYLAVLSVGVWVLLAPREIVKRIVRAAVVVVGALLAASWVLVPLLADRNFAAQSSFYKGSLFNDSYGARKILGWLISGELFDHGRFPILTLLVGVGFVTCIIRARRNEPERALLGVGLLSLLLFFGRRTWGSLVNVLPGNGDLQMHRFIVGVHMAGIFMAGIGLYTCARWAGIGLAYGWETAARARSGRAAHRPASPWTPIAIWTVVAVAAVGVLAPAWIERGRYDLRDGGYINGQRRADATDGADLNLLIEEAEIRGGGRIYAGSRANWGAKYLIGSVPAHAELSAAGADGIGFTFRTVQSLSTDIEASFDEASPAQYQMMNIRYVILPSNRQPSVPAKLLDSQGRHRLYEVNTSGYFQVVDLMGSVTANRTDLAQASAGFLNSNQANQNVYPAVAFNGAAAAPATSPGTSPPPSSPGSVLQQVNDRENGAFSARVEANRRSLVLLKESYDPRWTVTVDGKPAHAVMVAPSLVGVEVAAGRHTIAFRYKPYSHYELLIAIGLLTLIGLAAWPRRKALARRAREWTGRTGAPAPEPAEPADPVPAPAPESLFRARGAHLRSSRVVEMVRRVELPRFQRAQFAGIANTAVIVNPLDEHREEAVTNDTRRRPHVDPGSMARIAILGAPVVVLAWMGWMHRWTCDDAFINFRIVRQLLAGHGPVFNIGDRVEAGTSPLWLAVLAVLDLVTPFRIEWIALFASLAAAVGGIALAILGTRRVLLSTGAAAGALVPLGALAYVALPPAWDFSTSGLEVGLSLLWIGTSWWLLTGRVGKPAAYSPLSAPWKPWWVPVVLGLGPLVRPDFLIFSFFFLVAWLLLSGERGWKPNLLAIGFAAALPVITELLRMGYYGSVEPNTAIAKEGTLSNWHQGWWYLRDFFGPHLLLVPVLLLAGAFLVPMLWPAGADTSRVRVLFGLAVAAALVHILYVVRLGGDYMHGRMLLPSLFVLLLPVSVVTARGLRWFAVAALVFWAAASISTLRPAYSGQSPGGAAPTALAAIDPVTKISDERLVHMRLSGKAHPVTLSDYAQGQWARAGMEVHAYLSTGRRMLIFDPDSAGGSQAVLVRLRNGIKAPLVAYVGAVGMYAYAAGDSVEVLDRFGVTDALSAHQKLLARGRPGHEKDLPPAWVFAAFAQPSAEIPSSISVTDVQAARTALGCGNLARLSDAAQAPFGFGRFMDNLTHAVTLSTFRFDPSPQNAARNLCGG